MSATELLQNERTQSLERLIELVRIPSVSTDSRYRPQMEQAAELVMKRCVEAGLKPELIETARHPAVVAANPHRPGRPTLLIYGHYDVQPAEDVELWQSPPFEPEVRDNRLYGRGASDNKGQISAHLEALRRLHQSGGIPINVVVLVEGEEEIGSPNLPDLLERYRQKFQVDLAVVSDTSTAIKGRPTIHYSLRGIVIAEVFLEVASRDIHSGVYGGTTENPVRLLTQLCARLHDQNNFVTVPGFYDRVLEMADWEKEHLERLPFDEAAYLEWIGASQPVGEAGFSTNERRWFRPTLEFNGIYGGYQGEGSKTIVPASAGVKLSARLVAAQKPDEVMACLKKWFEDQCPSWARLTFTPGDQGPPYYLNIAESPYYGAAARAIQEAFGEKPFLCRHGGAIPIVSRFEDILGVKTLLMGLGSPDDAIHSYNEKFELDNFYRGIRMSEIFIRELAQVAES